MKKGFNRIFANLFYIAIISLLFASLSFSAEIDRIRRHEARIFQPCSNEIPSYLSEITAYRTSDFFHIQISESVAPATFSQKLSSVAALDDGGILICWQDNRCGNLMIYRQKFDADGDISGTNMHTLGRDDSDNIIEPKAVTDGDGGYFVVWRDEPTGWILAGHFNSDGELQTEFVVNSTELGSYTGPFDIAAYPGGKLAVAWENYYQGNNIILQIYNNSGTPLTSQVIINSDGGDVSHWEPSVTVEPSGNMAVVWEDYRNGNADIFLQFVNSDGTLSGDNLLLVDPDYKNFAQYMPKVVYSSTEGYIAGWLDKRSGVQRAYIQKVTRSGGTVGDNINISDNAEGTQDWDIALTVNSSGNLAAAWASVDGEDRIIVQRFGSDLTPYGPIRVANSYEAGARWETALQYDSSGRLYCTWSDFRNGNWDIYLKQFTSAGTPVTDYDIKINDDKQGAHSSEPVIANIEGQISGQTELYVVAFTDKRNDAGDIFYQLTNPDGSLVASNRKVNDDVIPALQNGPDIATADMNNTIVWVDNRAVLGEIGQRIFAKHFFPESIPAAEDFAVSDTNSITSKADPSVAAMISGAEMYAWVDYESGDGQIYARNVKPETEEWTDIYTVSLPDVEFDNIDLSVHADNSDIFTIAYLSRGIEGGPSAVFARYDTDGNFIDRFYYDSDQTGVEIKNIAVDVNADGDIYLGWLGTGTAEYIYLTVLDNTGSVIEPTMQITALNSELPDDPDISVADNGMTVMTWIDFRTGRPQAYYQILDGEFNFVDANSPVSLTETRFAESPRVLAEDLAAWITWVDPRTDGKNVFLRKIEYYPTDIGDEINNNLPTGFVLYQNYPNPFNPATSIKFTVPIRGHVNIAVYDLLGRKIRTLVDQPLEAGSQSVLWDGMNTDGESVASGLYFYRMKTDSFEETRKMMLLK